MKTIVTTFSLLVTALTYSQTFITIMAGKSVESSSNLSFEIMATHEVKDLQLNASFSNISGRPHHSTDVYSVSLGYKLAPFLAFRAGYAYKNRPFRENMNKHSPLAAISGYIPLDKSAQVILDVSTDRVQAGLRLKLCAPSGKGRRVRFF